MAAAEFRLVTMYRQERGADAAVNSGDYILGAALLQRSGMFIALALWFVGAPAERNVVTNRTSRAPLEHLYC